MTTLPPLRTKIFVSYSHHDREWLDRLRTHLKPLERTYELEVWDDTRIKPGSKWREGIRQAIRTTRVAILLVSANFLASDFIITDELPPLLNAAEKEGATILPLILSPCRFLRTQSLSDFQSVNDPSKPLLSLPRGEQEEVFVRVSEFLEDALSTARYGEARGTEGEPPVHKAALGAEGERQFTQADIEADKFQKPIMRVPNNDLGYGIVINGEYKGQPLEIVASPWARYGDKGRVISGWLYASPYFDVSHAVAFFKLHLREDGTGYIHILDSSNPVHTIEMTTETGFHRKEEFCWDCDPEVHRTSLWEFR